MPINDTQQLAESLEAIAQGFAPVEPSFVPYYGWPGNYTHAEKPALESDRQTEAK
jgi:hypothetical protein